MEKSKSLAVSAATRVYSKHGLKAHLIRNYASGSLVAACGSFQKEWLGTGNQDEYDRAGVMGTCRSCVERI